MTKKLPETLVLRIYVCWDCDYHMSLVHELTENVILQGDCYHDKIDQKIQGFIEGLGYCGIEIIMLDQIERKCEYCQSEEEEEDEEN